MNRVLRSLNVVLFILLLPGLSLGAGKSQFEKKLDKLGLDALAMHIYAIEKRVEYLESPIKVQNNYILGVKPGNDKSKLDEQIKKLRGAHSGFSDLISEARDSRTFSTSCDGYFQRDAKVIDTIINNLSVISNYASVNTGAYIHKFWSSKEQTHTPPVEVVRALVQFELLSRVFLYFNDYFVSNRVSTSGVLNSKEGACFCKDRQRANELNKVRIASLEAAHFEIFGRRGVWDVQTLTRMMSVHAIDELDNLKNTVWIGSAIAGLVAVSWGSLAPYLSSAIGASRFAGWLVWMKRLGTVINYGFLGYIGYKALPELMMLIPNGESTSWATSSNTNDIFPVVDKTLSLVDSDYTLLKVVEDYEIEIHKNMVLQNPRNMAELWMPTELAKVSGDEALLLRKYSEKLSIMKRVFQEKRTSASTVCEVLY